LTFAAISTVEFDTEGTRFGPIEVEQVGDFRFVAGFGFGVVQRGHAVTVTIGRRSVQREVAGAVSAVAVAATVAHG
jgi:hypothetical protein